MENDVIINQYTYQDLKSFLEKIDSSVEITSAINIPNDETQKNFEHDLRDYLKCSKNQIKSVLGIDIYRYSKFDIQQQTMIPFVFQYLMKMTINTFFRSETLFSHRYQVKEFREEFIDTGDGGFITFQNPLDAVIFSMLFNAYLHLFNSYHLYPKLRKYLGPITIRYAITFDILYKIDSKFYGPAIINNARIMSKDKLNRLIIDDKTYEWFLLNTNGIENLPHLKKIALDHLNMQNLSGENLLSSAIGDETKTSGIRYVYCQKLEKILVKEDNFEIFNLTIQSYCSFWDSQHRNISVASTIGNMNCSGI
ncbi:hypothetical protein [Fibrobacter sp.]|uniref:hypothetical protein n=1 Tax=Fibrobacter sp. TaxID=35828 RepID=UPI00388EA494